MLQAMPRTSQANDADLVQRLRQGDESAMREVVERYQQRLFALIYGIVRDRHEVEDVAQEVFLKVFTRIDRFNGQSRFYTWLYRVAANAAKDHVKKRSRRPSVALEDDAVLPEHGDGPRQQASRRELREAVRRAISDLSPRYREILTLRELQGLTYNEVATVLRISIGTVESRLHRARAKLKTRLERHA